MANNLYRQFGGQPQTPNDGGFAQMAAQINNFADNYHGDPYAEAESLIRSGKITREKWNEALRLAHQIAPHLGRR